MGATRGRLACDLYAGAFSGEVVFHVETTERETYRGVAPKHYAHPHESLSREPVKGTLRVHVLENGSDRTVVAAPNGEVLEVPARAVAV